MRHSDGGSEGHDKETNANHGEAPSSGQGEHSGTEHSAGKHAGGGRPQPRILPGRRRRSYAPGLRSELIPRPRLGDAGYLPNITAALRAICVPCR